MSVRYIGSDPEGHKMAEELNKAMNRPHLVSTSNNKEKWPVCKKCGKHKMSIFDDTGLCFSCDEG